MTDFFPSYPLYFGVDAGKNFLRLAKLKKIGKHWDVILLKEIFEKDVNPLYKDIKKGVLASAISGRDVLVRACEIQLKKPKVIFDALAFHVEPLLPYPADEAILQAQIVGQHENGTSLTVFALRKDHLSLHLESLKKRELEPDIVTTKAHALAALLQTIPPAATPSLFVHEGEEEISLILAEKGLILAFRSIDARRDPTAEIKKNLLNFSTTYKTKSFETIYFLGTDPNLKIFLQNLSGKNVIVPPSPFSGISQEEFVLYGIAIGCALSHLQNCNFRQKEFSHSLPFQRLKRPLAAFLILTLLFAGGIWLFGEAALRHKRHNFEEAFSSFMKREKKEWTATLPASSFGDYSKYLDSLEKEIKSRPDTFPLLPQVPKVREILSWLASLSESQNIRIEILHYQMVKRPDFSHKQEKYKVRVDMEFSTFQTHAIPAFLEAIKNSNHWVDARDEIQWIPNKGKHKVSFYLKDKTKYN
jgi:type IV pilus assembly protein PilM